MSVCRLNQFSATVKWINAAVAIQNNCLNNLDMNFDESEEILIFNVLDALKNNTSLRQTTLRNVSQDLYSADTETNFENKVIDHVCCFLRNNGLTSFKVINPAVRIIQGIIPELALTQITKLELSCCHLWAPNNDEYLKISPRKLSQASWVKHILNILPRLEFLDLSTNKIGSWGICSFLKVLGDNKSLRHLNLFQNEYFDDDCARRATTLRANTKLETLIIGPGKCGEEGMVALTSAIASNEKLRKFCFINNNLTQTRGFGARFSEIIRFNTLQKLDLTNDFFPQDPGLPESETRLLITSLEFNRGLKSVKLNGNKIGDQMAGLLASRLKNNRTLTALELDGNDLTPAGIQMVCAAFATNTILQKLSLGSNQLGGSGESLGGLISSNTTLTKLNICSNDLQQRDYDIILQSLKATPYLTTLELNMPYFSEYHHQIECCLDRNRYNFRQREPLMRRCWREVSKHNLNWELLPEVTVVALVALTGIQPPIVVVEDQLRPIVPPENIPQGKIQRRS